MFVFVEENMRIEALQQMQTVLEATTAMGALKVEMEPAANGPVFGQAPQVTRLDWTSGPLTIFLAVRFHRAATAC